MVVDLKLRVHIDLIDRSPDAPDNPSEGRLPQAALKAVWNAFRQASDMGFSHPLEGIASISKIEAELVTQPEMQGFVDSRGELRPEILKALGFIKLPEPLAWTHERDPRNRCFTHPLTPAHVLAILVSVGHEEFRAKVVELEMEVP